MSFSDDLAQREAGSKKPQCFIPKPALAGLKLRTNEAGEEENTRFMRLCGERVPGKVDLDLFFVFVF